MVIVVVIVVVELIASMAFFTPQFVFYNEQQLSAFFRREN